MNWLNKILVTLLLTFGLSWPVVSGVVDLPRPEARDTCPVCGMFVAKYPSWIASVRYRDGHMHHFDGAKDLFKYLLEISRWAPGHQLDEIEAIGVTDYYSLALVDAQTAFFVIGSDVLGPMGHELIPLETQEDAEEFMRDHKGVRVLRQNEVTLELLIGLDKGAFK